MNKHLNLSVVTDITLSTSSVADRDASPITCIRCCNAITVAFIVVINNNNKHRHSNNRAALV